MKLKKSVKGVLAVLVLAAAGAGGYTVWKKAEEARIAEQLRLEEERRTEQLYLKSADLQVELQGRGEETENITLTRGTEVTVRIKPLEDEEEGYRLVHYNEQEYLLTDEYLCSDLSEAAAETEGWTCLPSVLYENSTGPEITGMIDKKNHVEILGYGTILEDGTVDRYLIRCGEREGYIRYEYIVKTEEDIPDTVDAVHYEREDRWGGGDAYTLDYPDLEKGNFEDNPMPVEVRALYLNKVSAKYIDEYINIANSSGINTFVIDMKESDGAAYESPVIKEYNPASYEQAYCTFDEYKESVQKAKDAGIYVVGRIVTFKDDYYAVDHPENALTSYSSGGLFKLAGAYWPSPYQRKVWEYNVKLGIEGIEEIGFNEIQFDYIRFPDNIYYYQDDINFQNDEDETMAQAINRFLLYARDEFHQRHAYLSCDVFGETSNEYVCAYGQYWPMMSNIADVMSAMPYPDHFETYAYGISQPVWTVPGQLLRVWGMYVMARQEETRNPANVRTWLQGYDSVKEPFVSYDVYKIIEQIEGLYDAGLTGGYIVWNSPAEVWRYYSYIPAFTERITE